MEIIAGLAHGLITKPVTAADSRARHNACRRTVTLNRKII
jgi:hypothetical protein